MQSAEGPGDDPDASPHAGQAKLIIEKRNIGARPRIRGDQIRAGNELAHERVALERIALNGGAR
jgi:hypothetical protein